MDVLDVRGDIPLSGGNVILVEVLLRGHILELLLQTVAHILGEQPGNGIDRSRFESLVSGRNGWAEIGTGRLQTGEGSPFAGAMNANHRLEEKSVG